MVGVELLGQLKTKQKTPTSPKFTHSSPHRHIHHIHDTLLSFVTLSSDSWRSPKSPQFTHHPTRWRWIRNLSHLWQFHDIHYSFYVHQIYAKSPLLSPTTIEDIPSIVITLMTQLWHSLVTLTCDTHLWRSLVTHNCKTHLWHSLMTLTYDTHLWHSLVTLTCYTQL